MKSRNVLFFLFIPTGEEMYQCKVMCQAMPQHLRNRAYCLWVQPGEHVSLGTAWRTRVFGYSLVNTL